MLRVALTGGVGSGKTAVAAILRELGAPVSNSDEIGRALMQPGQPVFDAIVANFGREVLQSDGTLNRAALGRIAFGEGRVEDLNAIVHPAVIAAQNGWMQQMADPDPHALAIVESALVFETKYGAGGEAQTASPWRCRFDRIILVTAPVDTRRARFIARSNASNGSDSVALSADFDGRTAAQWSDDRKAALSDFLIVNDGTLSHLRAQVEPVYAALRKEAATK